MKKKQHKRTMRPILYFGAVALPISVEQVILNYSSPLKTPQELQYALAEEAKELEIADKKIVARFDDTNSFAAYSRKLPDGSYEIILGNIRSRPILRHELYHIADGHHEDVQSKEGLEKVVWYFFVYEPQAAAYELCGWRL